MMNRFAAETPRHTWAQLKVSGMAMHEPDDRAEVDALITAFFGAFDNRCGRKPEIAEMMRFFSAGAIVTKHAGGQCTLYSPEGFASPRVALLTSGELTGFYEWEEANATEMIESLAIRTSRYAKSGTYNGEPYAGTGIKFFQLAKIASSWKIVALSWIDDT